MKHYNTLIVGGGHAGAQVATALRQAKFAGSIAILSDETDLPYERPPLSKDYLLGEKTFDQICLRPMDVWREMGVEIELGQCVAEVRSQDHRVVALAGAEFGYDHLIWAAGGRARRLGCKGADLRGVLSVRTRADVDALKTEMDAVQQVVVIGGGYIGLEVAAALRKLGKRVVVLEALDRVLARVAGEPLSRFFEGLHRDHGVDLRLGCGVDSLVEGTAGRVVGVRLTDGSTLAADLVVVGIGIMPNIEPLKADGAIADNGVQVDGQCRTSLKDVFAIGDCALHANRYAFGRWLRLESVQNAHDQAVVAAKTIAGQVAVYDKLPWFWSLQYDVRLQTAGISSGFEEAIVKGDPGSSSFAVEYFRSGKLIAADCVNSPRAYMEAQKRVRATFGEAVH